MSTASDIASPAADLRARLSDASWVALGVAVILCLLLYPLLGAQYLPLTDLPNHMARHTIMADVAAGGPLTEYYTTQFVLVPNSAADLLWRLLGYPGDAVAFSYWVMSFSAANLLLSTLVLARVVHGRWTAWSLAAGLMVYNCTFLFGFQNYSFTLPFAIYAFALYLRLETRALWLRALVFATIAPVLFLMHFFAFGVLGALAFGRELQKLAEDRTWAALARGAIMGMPFVLPVLWLAYGILTGPASPAGSYTDFGTLQDRLNRFLTPIFALADDDVGPMNAHAVLITLALYAALATAVLPRIGLTMARVMWGPVAVMVVVALAAPVWLSGVAMVDVRFVFVMILIAIAATRWPEMAFGRAVLLAAAVLGATGLRSAQINDWFQMHDQEMRDLMAVMSETVEPGDRVLPVRAPGRFNDERLWHVQGYATATQKAFMPTLFQGVHAVQLRLEWADHATPTMHANPACAIFQSAPPEPGSRTCRKEPYTQGWDTKFNKVLAMEPLPAALVATAPLRLSAQVGRFQIYDVISR
ncbi:hypothetical protein [Shimia ponticola]|uniref:hypothetical protein n=1 Tax=Shimia ponticola TaxID=2582893 RepID=UPI0011BF797A|nr:hypothetical protein [Shimia ponticola]